MISNGEGIRAAERFWAQRRAYERRVRQRWQHKQRHKWIISILSLVVAGVVMLVICML